jgi:hypothetical protein
MKKYKSLSLLKLRVARSEERRKCCYEERCIDHGISEEEREKE